MQIVNGFADRVLDVNIFTIKLFIQFVGQYERKSRNYRHTVRAAKPSKRELTSRSLVSASNFSIHNRSKATARFARTLRAT